MGLDPNKKGDPAFDDMDTDSELEGSDPEIPEEPEELIAARQKLAALKAAEGERQQAQPANVETKEREQTEAEGRDGEEDEDMERNEKENNTPNVKPDATPQEVISPKQKEIKLTQKTEEDDFDLMIKGQQVLEVVYKEESDDDEILQSHPLPFDELDFEAMD